MESSSTRNSRIARNTAMLYARTFAVMIFSLFTSRLILQLLGIENFGIYQAVGGATALFAILTGALSSAASRFITFSLGSDSPERQRTVFSTCVNVLLIVAAGAFLIAEAGGSLMLRHLLSIPPERMEAARWVLQISILTFIIDILSVPYIATIIAHERLKFFATMGIFDIVMKLLFVAALYVIPGDKLIVYSLALFIILIIERIIYGRYCSRRFPECHYNRHIDRKLLREMGSFAGFTFGGNAVNLLNTQGINVLINIFFGVTLNAARGVVGQAETAIMQFVNNFTTATTPQITKSYAAGDSAYLNTLICRSAKFSYFLLLFFILPVILEAPEILTLWLGEVPPDAPLFLRWSLGCTAVVILGNSSATAIEATGRVRAYQTAASLTALLLFPTVWVAYRLGCPAQTAYAAYMLIYGAINLLRLRFMRKLMEFPVRKFLREALLPVLLVSLSATLLPLLLHLLMPAGLWRLAAVAALSTASTAAAILATGLTPTERQTILSRLKGKGR